MAKVQYKLSLLTTIAFLLALIFTPERAYAQWPPFHFYLAPLYENGKITYNIIFSNEADWSMTDVFISVPLPEGTRFLEANAQPNTQITFDGVDITIFTATVHDSIKNASFVVEVTNPAMTVFTTHAWLAWKGDQPGDYLTEAEPFDITRPSLNWVQPGQSRLQLGVSATVANNVITYNLYPKNVGGLRMWDVKINVPIPAETTFLSVEAPPPFVTGFDGREVSFFVTELERLANIGPLSFKVSLTEAAPPFVTTHAWTTWKNAGRRVGRSIPPEEQTFSGDLILYR
jgi:uncharacterized repeat protein (TIGR01451 family)